MTTISLALLLMFVPVIWFVAAKQLFYKQAQWQFIVAGVVLVSLVICGGLYFSRYSQEKDVEIINGQVLNKRQVSVPCEHSYQCHCRTNSKGSTSCDTCYEHFNDWDWRVYTSVGQFNVSRIDPRGSRQPDRWTKININEPVAKEHNYVNYVKAVPDSLFHELKDTSIKNIPAYPRVYDYTHVNRVIDVGAHVPEAVKQQLNTDIAMMLRTLGPQKQVNVNVIFVNTVDQSWRFALERNWLGGKKNDVTIILGMTTYPTLMWSDVMTWALNSGNELFHVSLRDSMSALTVFDPQKFVAIVRDQITHHYDRPHMAKYEYLSDEIEISNTALILIIVVALLSCFGLTYGYINSDFYRYNTPRRGYYR